MLLNGSLVIKSLRAGLCGLVLTFMVGTTPQPAGAVSVTFPGAAYLQGIVTVTYPSNTTSVNVVDSIVGFAQMAAAMSQPNWQGLIFALYRLATGGGALVDEEADPVSVPLVPLIGAQVFRGEPGSNPSASGLGSLFMLGGLGANDEPFVFDTSASDIQGIALDSGVSGAEPYLLLWQLTELGAAEDDGTDDGGESSEPIIAAIPVPAPIVFLGSALIGLLGMSRLRPGSRKRPGAA